MSKQGQQKSQSKKGNKKQKPTTNKAQESINIANSTSIDNYTVKTLSKSSEKQKIFNLVAPIAVKDIQRQNNSLLREFPEPDQYNVLKMSGILDAYEHFLKLLCKHGLPTGRVYEYAAQQIEKYQRRKLNKELKMRAELDIQKIKKTKQEPSPEKPFHPSASPYLQH